ASLSVIKGNTMTTLVAQPPNPQVGEVTLFTATVSSASSNFNIFAMPPSGTVTFYINGVATQVALINGVATYSTVLTTETGNFVTAVYSGDTNWNSSTSSQLDILISPIPTTTNLSASQTNALYGANVVIKDNILVSPTTFRPYPNPPTGTVTFYDNFNGQTTLISTVGVTPLVLGQAFAQTTTTGLLPGTHYISALFTGGKTYRSSTSTIVIDITDYTVTFSPTSLVVPRGGGGSSTLTITPVNGFSGQVVLGCTAPGGAGITCSISPASITTGGTAMLSMTTTAAKAQMDPPNWHGRDAVVAFAGLSLTALFGGLLLPRRRRWPLLLLLAVASLGTVGIIGCTTQGVVNTQGIPGTGSSSGTPLGTQLLTITTQGTDGVTVTRHNSNFPVTVQ
ncbi:MAG: Ig-like domain-containing protein, partial [Bryocella sp.]